MTYPRISLARISFYLNNGKPRSEEINILFNANVGHLTSSSVPAVGHLPVYFQKMLMFEGHPRVGVPLLELTNALG